MTLYSSPLVLQASFPISHSPQTTSTSSPVISTTLGLSPQDVLFEHLTPLGKFYKCVFLFKFCSVFT